MSTSRCSGGPAPCLYSTSGPSLALHRLGIPARLIRPGYAQSLDRFDPAAARPIDVLFLGTHSLRRAKYLNRAAGVLSRHNCLLQIAEAARARTTPALR